MLQCMKSEEKKQSGETNHEKLYKRELIVENTTLLSQARRHTQNDLTERERMIFYFLSTLKNTAQHNADEVMTNEQCVNGSYPYLFFGRFIVSTSIHLQSLRSRGVQYLPVVLMYYVFVLQHCRPFCSSPLTSVDIRTFKTRETA